MFTSVSKKAAQEEAARAALIELGWLAKMKHVIACSTHGLAFNDDTVLHGKWEESEVAQPPVDIPPKPSRASPPLSHPVRIDGSWGPFKFDYSTTNKPG